MLLVKYVSVILHILTAAAWFGLALRVVSQARLSLSVDVAAGRAVAADNHRSVGLMNLFAALTVAFAALAFFAGGGFEVYGPAYHASLLLILILAAVQFLLIRPASAGLLGVLREGIPSSNEASAYRKRLAMGVGIGHTLWLVLLVLMFWNRLQVAL